MSSMDTLKRHLPISGLEGLHELRKIVEGLRKRFILLPQARYIHHASIYSTIPQDL